MARYDKGAKRWKSKHHNFHTPPEIWQALLRAFDLKEFACDPCSDYRIAPNYNVPAKIHFDEVSDGLQSPWPVKGHIFLNPPYGDKLERFVTKAVNHAKANPDATVWLLLPLRSDNRYYHKQLYQSDAAFTFIFSERYAFGEHGVFKNKGYDKHQLTCLRSKSADMVETLRQFMFRYPLPGSFQVPPLGAYVIEQTNFNRWFMPVSKMRRAMIEEGYAKLGLGQLRQNTEYGFTYWQPDNPPDGWVAPKTWDDIQIDKPAPSPVSVPKIVNPKQLKPAGANPMSYLAELRQQRAQLQTKIEKIDNAIAAIIAIDGGALPKLKAGKTTKKTKTTKGKSNPAVAKVQAARAKANRAIMLREKVTYAEADKIRKKEAEAKAEKKG